MIPCHTLFSEHGGLPVIITGNLKIYHILTRLDRYFSSNKLYLSNPYYNEAYNTDFMITNKSVVITRQIDIPSKQNLCIDLTLYNEEISNHIQSWQSLRKATGFDHTIMHTCIRSPFDTTGPLKHNWLFIDYKLRDTVLRERVRVPPPLEGDSNALESWFNLDLDSITAILNQNTIILHSSKQSMKQWTQELSDLRRIFNTTSQSFCKHHSLENRKYMKQTCTINFRAIDKA